MDYSIYWNSGMILNLLFAYHVSVSEQQNIKYFTFTSLNFAENPAKLEPILHSTDQVDSRTSNLNIFLPPFEERNESELENEWN